MELGPFASNCYLVGSERTREGMIIDPGAEPKAILREVEKERLQIKLIVITHAHMDHTMALQPVKEATGAPYAVHAEDAGFLFSGFGRQLASLVGMGASAQEPLPPDQLLRGGETITIGDLSFQVLHTPGHSPGGICLYGDGVVFTGDTLFNFGIGRTDFPGCSMEQLLESIITRLLVLPDQTVVLPGHGPRSTIGVERQWNPFLREGAL